MPAVILDACVTLNLYASGQFLPILSTLPHAWHLPVAVEREAQYYRQPAPDDPQRLVVVPLDLRPAFAAGLLQRCDCESAAETALYVDLASQLGDDGESLGLAIAKCRGWTVLTDDKKARRIARELGVDTRDTTQILRQWSDTAVPSPETVRIALEEIERFANFRPTSALTHTDWWFRVLQGPRED